MRLWRAGILVLVAITAAGCTADPPPSPVASLLLFTKTAGYRHDSIADGIAALTVVAAGARLRVDATEDASVFTDEGLHGYAALVFLDTTGAVLDADQRAAMERYVHGGGGFVGIHAAADGDPAWPWYAALIGAGFRGHPPLQAGRLEVVDRAHPVTADLPGTWERTDEWYDFTTNPRDHVRVLVTVDESSYDGGQMGADHPLAWCQEFDGARAFYTAMGHTSESFQEPAFLAHLLGGLRWAAGLAAADCAAR